MKNPLLISFCLGFLTASPIGPMGLLCLRRTLSRGVSTGLISALGISTADAFWSFVAVRGLTALSHWIQEERIILEGGIGLFFLLYGANGTFNAPRMDYPTSERGGGGVSEFLSTFLVVFLNPTTFIMFSALFAISGIADLEIGTLGSLEIAGAVFAGSITFWIVFTEVLRRVKDYIQPSSFALIARLSSCVIAVFGVSILLLCFRDYLFGN